MRKEALEYLETYRGSSINDDIYSDIEDWFSWYRGKVKGFHNYSVYNGIRKVGLERYSMGMPKKICEDWANLLLNEKVSITTGDERKDNFLNAILIANKFQVRANRLVELTYALGTGAFVTYLSADGEVIIDYIRADMIVPLSWDNGEITECAFASPKIVDGKELTYLQIHYLEGGNYVIKNVYLNDKGDEEALPEGLAEEVNTGLSSPLFAILRPNIVNNAYIDSPMGISCYANAIDQIKGLDIAYDSYINEFSLGKKRILVPLSMARIDMARTGDSPVFDANDTVFYAIKSGDDTDNKIINFDSSLRTNEHSEGINQLLALLSFKVGLGNDRYKFDSSGLKTATEVISEKSELYQSVCKNELVLEDTLRSLTVSALHLAGLEVNQEDISVLFDDSIIVDEEAEAMKMMQEVSLGLIKPEKYLAERYNVSEEEALKLIPEPKPYLERLGDEYAES